VRLRTVLIGSFAVILVLVVGTVLVVRRLGTDLQPLPLGRACQVTAAGGTVELDTDQMANAATIAAVGIRRRLPDQALVVALATAFQESKLRNLAGGDRDSIGLFQQRPSQGWGSAKEIRDPRYSAGRFYSALIKVRDWQEMRVTEAAQRVQRSAYPEAYQKWSDEATVLVEALAGQAGGAVACGKIGQPTMRGIDAVQALGVGLRLDWGDVPTVSASEVVGLVVAAANQRAGWQYAHWLVAHSTEKNVQRVQFGGHEWTADRGQWKLTDTGGVSAGITGGITPERVVAEVYRS
jgi:hypothetical protein